MTFALYQHTSTRATKKSVWSDFKGSLGCAYSTFVTAINEAAIIALRILFIVMRMNRRSATVVKFTDATDIPVCLAKNGKRHRTMRGLSAWGQLALYRRRFKIEFDFRSLKMFHGLVTSLPRSVNGYIGNYILALLSFALAN